MKRDLVLIAHNVRSTHNVGSLIRTSEGLGVKTVYLTGYTPFPSTPNDERLPHLANKISRQINKTALGAEVTQHIKHEADIKVVISELKKSAYEIIALEQSSESKKLPEYKALTKLALIVGREVEGIEPEVLKITDKIIEIPMFGKKESFNVAQAAAMALYHFRFIS